MANKIENKWGDPGVTELLQIQETPIQLPAATGGSVTRTLQRSGYLKRLRFEMNAKTTFSGTLGTHIKSAYGPLGGMVNNIKVMANGQIPLVDLSGLGATIYNEIQNRDGSMLARPDFTTGIGLLEGASPTAYDAASIAACAAKYPFEFQFALPVNIKGMLNELGLWLLQNQSIDVGVQVTFNPISSPAATNDALWNGSATVVSTPNLADNVINIERELYQIPNDPGSYPNLAWAHQVIEYRVPFTGGFSRFALPRAGMLLRAVVFNMDAAAPTAAIENTDIKTLSWIYGSNETPIARPGWALNQEFIQDYGRMSPKGVTVLDFYKWGENGLKLVKDTEALANLRLETAFSAATTGTQLIILDRLIPVLTR
jgi:hypothetical protein